MTTLHDIDALRRQAICVYCASSRQCDAEYHEAARRLGGDARRERLRRRLRRRWRRLDGRAGGRRPGTRRHRRGRAAPLHGRARVGPPGTLGAAAGRRHARSASTSCSERSQGVVALPGGCGTLDELFETLTLKRLGLYLHPIVLVNTRGFFDPLVELLLERASRSASWTSGTARCGRWSPSPRTSRPRSRRRPPGRATRSGSPSPDPDEPRGG